MRHPVMLVCLFYVICWANLFSKLSMMNILCQETAFSVNIITPINHGVLHDSWVMAFKTQFCGSYSPKKAFSHASFFIFKIIDTFISFYSYIFLRKNLPEKTNIY